MSDAQHEQADKRKKATRQALGMRPQGERESDLRARSAPNAASSAVSFITEHKRRARDSGNFPGARTEKNLRGERERERRARKLRHRERRRNVEERGSGETSPHRLRCLLWTLARRVPTFRLRTRCIDRSTSRACCSIDNSKSKSRSERLRVPSLDNEERGGIISGTSCIQMTGRLLLGRPLRWRSWSHRDAHSREDMR
jgi:hypothetical protein